MKKDNRGKTRWQKTIEGKQDDIHIGTNLT